MVGSELHLIECFTIEVLGGNSRFALGKYEEETVGGVGHFLGSVGVDACLDGIYFILIASDFVLLR